MTTRAPRPCIADPTCPHRAIPGTNRCPIHATDHERERNRRRTESRKVYASPRWRNLRHEQLTRYPYCANPQCALDATDVDHIQPIAEGGNPWDPANLQSLCHAHHARKTHTETRRRIYR